MAEGSLKNILYAEDEADIRDIAKIALEDLGGFNVEYCANGNEVLQKINSFKTDLLLLDVMMPGMDGMTVFRKLREQPEFSTLPVIFMTAKIQSNEIAEYKSMGALDVIIKPFNPMLLAETVRTIWNKSRNES